MNVTKNIKNIFTKENFVTTYQVILVASTGIVCTYCWMIDARTKWVARVAGLVVLSYGVLTTLKQFYGKK